MLRAQAQRAPRSAPSARRVRERRLLTACRPQASSAATRTCSPAVVWLTPTHLRLHDHPALLAAAEATAGPLTCVVLADSLPRDAAPAVAALRAALRARGGDVCVRAGAPEDVLPAVSAAAGAATVFVSEESESHQADAVARASDALAGAGVRLQPCALPVWELEPSGEDNWRRHAARRGAVLPPAELPNDTQFAAPDGASDADALASSSNDAPFPLTEEGATAALDAFVGLRSDAAVQAAADAADAVRPGTSFAVLFERAQALGLLSPRRVAAAGNAQLRRHLAGGQAPWHVVREVSSVRRARAAAEAAELSAFHAALAVADRSRAIGSNEPAAPGVPTQRWWRWRGVLVPYVHVPGTSKRADARHILLVHGFGAFGEHWRGQLALADDAAGVWAPTLPGFGRAEKAALPYSQELWTAYLADFVREVVQAPVACAGNSIGGFMAANLAGGYPELVTELILVNSAGPLTPNYDAAAAAVAPARKVPPAFLINAVTAALLFYLERSITPTLRRCYPSNPDAADAWLAGEIFRAACDKGAPGVFGSVFYLPPPLPLNYLVERFGKRTLVLQGALDPLNDAPGRAQKLGALCANARVRLLQAGHCPHDELPEEWNAAVRELLAEAA